MTRSRLASAVSALTVLAAAAGCSSTSAPARTLVTLSGQARSVETTAGLAGVTSVHLSGSSVLTTTAEVTDHAGHRLGPGTLTAAGSDLVVAGPGIAVAGRWQIQPGAVMLNRDDGGSITLRLSSPSTVASGAITFQAPAPPAAATTEPSVTAVPPPATPPAPVTVAGPVTVARGALEVTGASLRYLDAPTDMDMRSAEADLSWAGSGSVTPSAGPAIQAPYLGVRAQQLKVSLHRGASAAAVGVQGTGLAVQAFADGVPQFRTTARIEVAATAAATGFAGHRRAFVWTPRNLGSTYDMAILGIRPDNAAAGQVHIGLAPMPPMFGGEPHSLVGGDTSGLKSGGAIDSLITRNGDDRRTIGYDGPAGVQLVLTVQGNFDPITVTVTTR